VFILNVLTGVAFCIAGSKSEENSIERSTLPGKGLEERTSRAGGGEQAGAPIS
jgi:hypothetical protein